MRKGEMVKKLAELEQRLTNAETSLAAVENGVRMPTSPTEYCYAAFIVVINGKTTVPRIDSVVGAAIVDVVRQLEPAINAMVLKRVQEVYDNALLELQEACREAAEL